MPDPLEAVTGTLKALFEAGQSMTLAAVDRPVHHATIFEMNVESYRRKAAEKAKGRGRPPKKASPADMNAD